MDAADLESYWADISPPDSERRVTKRPGSLRPHWEPPPSGALENWVNRIGEEGQRPIVLVEGPTPAHRQALYRIAKIKSKDLDSSWIDRGVVEELTERFSHIRCIGSIGARPWDLIWNFLTLEELVVEEPLKDLIDQGLLFTQAFRAIWEARFLLKEGRDIQPLVEAFTGWITASTLTPEAKTVLGNLGIERELSTPFERLDMLFFLAALAHQNHLVDRLLFVLDGLDRAVTQGTTRRRELLKELDHFCTSADRWSKLDAPIGFVLGYSNEHRALNAIEKSNSKLGDKLQRYLSV
jgi:hypothetical protein